MAKVQFLGRYDPFVEPDALLVYGQSAVAVEIAHGLLLPLPSLLADRQHEPLD